MQIKIEIDVRPEELRRFLGLPDVSGLQEDVISFLRDKLGAASDFDAPQFVRNNIDVLRRNPAWKKLAGRLGMSEAEADARATVKKSAAPARSKRSPRKAAAAARKAASPLKRTPAEPGSDDSL